MRMGVGKSMGMVVLLFPIGMAMMGMPVIVMGMRMRRVNVRVSFAGRFMRGALIGMRVFPFVERVVCHGFSPVFLY